MSYLIVQKAYYSLYERIHIPLTVAPQLMVGVPLLLLYMLEVLHETPLSRIFMGYQQDEVYKQITGFLLFAYMLLQWRLALVRTRGHNTLSSRILQTHIWLGVFTPCVLFVHAAQTGHGYQALLLSLFFGNVVLGLLSPKMIKVRHKNYVLGWLIAHVGLAVLVVLLLFYHLYVVYFYS